MRVVRFETNLVYQYLGSTPLLITPPNGYEWCLLNEDTIQQFFGYETADRWRYFTYTKLLKKGYFGHIIHSNNMWAAVQWLATPQSPGPPHLPKKVAAGDYWCFNEHTRESHRRLGLWSSLKDYGVRFAREDSGNPLATVFSDTVPDNFASRNAHQAYGFVSAGVIHGVTIQVPQITSFRFGKWNRFGNHPDTTSFQGWNQHYESE